MSNNNNNLGAWLGLGSGILGNINRRRNQREAYQQQMNLMDLQQGHQRGLNQQQFDLQQRLNVQGHQMQKRS